MQVAQLLERLANCPKDAHVVVGGEVVHDIEVVNGKIELGYYNPQFERGKGKDTAVVFLANTELSTGEVVSMAK